MKKLFAVLLMLPLMAAAKDVNVKSPDGNVVVTISDEGGRLTYQVTLNGQTVLQPSQLGFEADFGTFATGLHISDTLTTKVEKDYEMRQVKQHQMHFRANQLLVSIENEKRQQMSVEFQVANNDLAFRYLIPRQQNDNPKSAVVKRELTAFRLPSETTTFLTPQITPMTGWERTKPSYEEEYKADAPMTAKSQYGQGYTFPCLFKSPNAWMLISETGVSSAYCGSHLSDYHADNGYTIAYPQAGENNGNGSPFAGIPLPGQTPWRTITLGTTLKPIVETTIAYDVVDPLYEPSTDYKGGRYTWSWLIWQDNSINYNDQVQFIDLASAMGYELCLVDNWWDQNIGRTRMEQLSKYAQSKGVSLMLWYNSNGYENDAPQTPRDCMSTSMARDKEMAWLKSIGVKGIKVDFFGGDKQETMKLYEDILYDANRYGLQVIFHGCTLPRGWERMYPNYVSSEAVLASENVFFNEGAAIRQPFDLTMHPFCRNASGTMDWGGVIMNKYLSKDNKSRHTRKTTDIFEMATGITNQSVINCVAMQPNNLKELPQFELDFLKQLPTQWDETRFIDGYPGKYVVLARRHGQDWYVAGLNAQQEAITLNIDLSMFGKGQRVKLYTDSPKKRRSRRAAVATPAPRLGYLTTNRRTGAYEITIEPNGGIIITK